MKNKSVDNKIRQLLNKRKPIICVKSSHDAFVDGKQDYINVRIDGMYYHYKPKTKVQEKKVKYHRHYIYDFESK